MSVPPRSPQPESYRPFDLADYPAYEFQPDGTPVRVVPATRGKFAGWTGPIRSYTRVNHTGSAIELFGITRGDGVQRQVTRATILKALGSGPPLDRPLSEDPWEGPPGNQFPRRSIDGYPDYVADALGRVYRFQSPGRGRYTKPFQISALAPGHKRLRTGSTRPEYFVLDSVTGHRRYVTAEAVLELAGWNEEETRAARMLEIAIC